MFKIETENLVLRDFKVGDSQAYVNLTRDEKYQRFYSEEDCQDSKSRMLVDLFVEKAVESPRTMYQLAITLKTTGEVIGTCGIRLEEHSQASMGCGVARKFQGTGFAKEAASALIDFGFTQLNIHRVYAETMDANRAAIALCRQLGMNKEAHFVEHRYFKNQWWDTVIVAMLKSDWIKRRGE
ncbi:GNAT family N-acetyltransferase [Vibrio makurazakiensis]|uniref:GNAT family N-acetyltransferase n=1 Tax=Vibrio makurazakiensis TaxID=2910250 RepID=UPI003D0B368B